MILIDYNQIAIGSLMVALNRGQDLDKNLVRHITLNNLRFYRTKFKEEYGELVICCDSRHYWRRDYFPNYKANRKKDREASGHDWDLIFETLNDIRDELKAHFPYKVVDVYGAEADDIIAVLVKERGDDKNMIISSDKDFIQLHAYHVSQYSPVTKKEVNGKEPVAYLREHILRGDRSDGIPNVLSDDDVFVEGRRQRPLTKKKIASWVDEMVMTFTEEEQKNYDRNRELIDLSCIPPELEAKIYNEFDEVKVAHRSKILNYFITRKLKTLIEVIDEF